MSSPTPTGIAQYPTAPHGVIVGTVPAMGGAEATTTGTEPITPTPSDQSMQALDSNASATQSLVRDTAISGEYIDESVETQTPIEQKQVEPLARAALSSPATTMDSLHRMSENELNILETLTNEGKQRLKDRLMRIWDEMARRFELGETLTINDTTVSGTGGKGMGRYLRLIGIDPAKRRFWKFEVKQKDMLLLAREIAPGRPKNNKKKGIVIEGETEAHHIAKRGLRIAQTLAEESMVSPQERVTRAQSMSKELLQAIAGGNYDESEPLPASGTLPMPEQVTYSDWKNHRMIPASQYKLKYFEDASRSFSDRYHYAFQGAAFKKILEVLENKPEQVLANTNDFAQLADVLREAVNNLNLLTSAITTALISPTGPAPEQGITPENDQPAGQQREKTIAAELPGTSALQLFPCPSDEVNSALQDADIGEEDIETEQVGSPDDFDISDSESQQQEHCPPQPGAADQNVAPCSKMVYEANPGGPKVLEVSIPGQYSHHPSRLKYYVCNGEHLKPFLTLSEAKAACDKIAEEQQPTKDEPSNALGGQDDQSGERNLAPIAAVTAGAHVQPEPTLYYKKRTLRGDGEEFVDYPVFKRGANDVPEDVFDTESDAAAYIAKANEKSGSPDCESSQS